MMIDLTKLTTEQRNSKSMNLDQMSALEIATLMNEEDLNVVSAVKSQLESLSKAIEAAAHSIQNNGRLIYIGAGTSGRLGVLDSVECPPTFGVSQELVQGLIAGGDQAFVKAVEGAEDSKELGRQDLERIQLTANDTVVGIAASGRTPYVIGAFNYANEIGATVVSIANNKDSEIGKHASICIELVNGPEVLTGSTRLKSGTSQKMALNIISTGAMVRSGKVYQNLMVDVQQTNQKLQVRAQNIVIEATGVSRDEAIETLEKASGHVKLAIVMILSQVDAQTATKKLEAAKGHVRLAIQ